MRRKRDVVRWASVVLIALGGALLALNVGGSFVSLRSPGLENDPAVQATDPVRVSFDVLKREIPRKPGETEDRYARRLTPLLDAGVAHYWEDAGIDQYHLRIPPWENWILFTMSFVKPEIFRKYELVDPDKAVERGVGLCSQQALTLQLLLNREGIRSDVVYMNGHVVDEVHPRDGRPLVADPDTGVVFDGTIFEVRQNPEGIRERYAERFGVQHRDLQEHLARVLQHHPVVVGPAAKYVDPRVFVFERVSWTARWVVPFLLLLGGLLLARERRDAGPVYESTAVDRIRRPMGRLTSSE